MRLNLSFIIDWLKNFPGLLFRAEEMFGQKYKDIILYK